MTLSPEPIPVLEPDTTPEDTSQLTEPDFVEAQPPPRSVAKTALAAPFGRLVAAAPFPYRNVKPNTLSAPHPITLMRREAAI